MTTRYAFVDALFTGSAVEVAGAFTGPDGQKYPANWLALSSPEDRTARGLQAITEPGPAPYGQRETSRELRVVGGAAVEVALYESIAIDSLVAEKVAAIDAERDRRLQLDFSFDFGALAAINDEGAEIAAGIRALQMRFDPDQRNWQALQSQAVVAVISSVPTTLMPMRAEDNWNVQTTATEVLVATSQMFVRNAAILFHGAALKSQARLAVDAAGVSAVNLSTGWP